MRVPSLPVGRGHAVRTAVAVWLPAFLLPAAGPAEAQEREPPPVIRVAAAATVEVEPDRARLTVAVETRADSARQAAADNARRTEAVLRALRRLGISGEAVRTAGYQLQPVYERPPRPGPDGTREPRLVGYRAVNSVEATVDSLPLVGTAIDAAIGAGANRVAGLHFELRNPEAPRREALSRAVETARARAEAAAAASGARLGPVMEIVILEDRPIPLRARALDVAAAEMAAETPVEPGILTVTETVTVVWRLEEG